MRNHHSFRTQDLLAFVVRRLAPQVVVSRARAVALYGLVAGGRVARAAILAERRVQRAHVDIWKKSIYRFSKILKRFTCTGGRKKGRRTDAVVRRLRQRNARAAVLARVGLARGYCSDRS